MISIGVGGERAKEDWGGGLGIYEGGGDWPQHQEFFGLA